MKRRTLALGPSILLLSVLCGAVFAAEEPTEWCGTYDKSHPLAWGRFEEAVEQRMVAGDPEAAHLLIVDEFRRQMGTALDHEDVRLVLEATSVYMTVLLEAGVLPEVWRQDLRDDPERLQYELGPITQNDDDRFLELPCASFSDPTSPLPSIAYYAYAMYQAGQDGRLELARNVAAAVATTTYDSYHDLISNGLPMWPWELLLAGSRVPSDFTEPASTLQWIALRPNVGPLLRFDGTENSQMDFGLTVEPFGFIRYRNADYSKWWGASALIGLTNDNGVGYGVLFRYDNFMLGAAYHDKSDDVLLYLNIDLYKYVLGEDGRTNQAEEFSRVLIDRFINTSNDAR